MREQKGVHCMPGNPERARASTFCLGGDGGFTVGFREHTLKLLGRGSAKSPEEPLYLLKVYPAFSTFSCAYGLDMSVFLESFCIFSICIPTGRTIHAIRNIPRLSLKTTPVISIVLLPSPEAALKQPCSPLLACNASSALTPPEG